MKKGKIPSKQGISKSAVSHPEFREDLKYWIRTDRKIAMKIINLAGAVMRDPFHGIGKPEPLRHLGTELWSRRITQEHRLVCLVSDDRIDFIQARYRY